MSGRRPVDNITRENFVYTRPVAMRIERALIVLGDPLFNLEVNRRHKVPVIQQLNEAARLAAQRSLLARYGIEATA